MGYELRKVLWDRWAAGLLALLLTPPLAVLLLTSAP